MSRNLIIVESPTKAKTIRKMVGSNYKVVASVGHIRDLPKSTLGIDIENYFEPKYINIRGKGPLIKELKKDAKNATKVLLATDPDREGEAISWHLAHILELNPEENIRVTFNEITKDIVKKQIKEPRPLDMDLIDAQQARRILDRLVGYKISPLLWKKVKSGLSAGRVQSVVLKLICDRENEIQVFVPEEYWTITANLKSGRKKIESKYYGTKIGTEDVAVNLKSKEEVDKVLNKIDVNSFVVEETKEGNRTRRSQAPFTTSTLQQEASKRINFPTKKTMRVAQGLYEGVSISGEGSIGLITYMRTDSTRISEQAVASAKQYIEKEYGSKYCSPNTWSVKKENTQDAHECIRPTDIKRTPQLIADSLSRDELKLYKLIWTRFVASQMESAKYKTQKIQFINNGEIFKASGSTLIFDGFLRVYPAKDTDDKEIPLLNEDAVLQASEIDPEQHFTQPPARYNEASLIKLLEELGIGRPSTYAPIISTIQSRYYAVMEEKKLVPTELGETVNDLLVEYFPKFVNEEFTANMEKGLDDVAEGNIYWKDLVNQIYEQLAKYLEVAEKEIEKVEIRDEPTDVICDKCGKNMVIKMGRFGKFLACPGFPDCKNTKPYVETINVKCPKCDEGEIVVKRSKKGRKFFGCSEYPKCEFVSWNEPIEERCPTCNDILTKKIMRKESQIICHNPKCDYKRIEKGE